MENRNILMVIISVAVLFAIVFGISVMITWPKAGGDPELTSARGPETALDVESWFQDGKPLPGLLENTTFLGEVEPDAGREEPDNNGEVQSPFSIREAGESDAIQIEAEKDNIQYTKNINTGTRDKAVTATGSSTTTTIKKVSPTKAPPRRVPNYWIQTGAFKSRNSAENHNNKLAEKGFSGQIQTQPVDGSTFYRVRIGPYTVKAEADKFLTWIKEISDMQGSYITEVYVMQ